jgi:hypothetical protein
MLFLLTNGGKTGKWGILFYFSLTCQYIFALGVTNVLYLFKGFIICKTIIYKWVLTMGAYCVMHRILKSKKTMLTRVFTECFQLCEIYFWVFLKNSVCFVSYCMSIIPCLFWGGISYIFFTSLVNNIHWSNKCHTRLLLCSDIFFQPKIFLLTNMSLKGPSHQIRFAWMLYDLNRPW